MQIRIQVKCQYEIIQFPSNHTHTKQSTNSKSHTQKRKCTNPKSHTQKPNVQLQNH